MAPEVAFRVRSGSPGVTEALGEELGRALPAGAVVALCGELGAGKTTLVRGLARGLEVGDAVQSPTFTRMRVLAGRLPLYHFDAWRSGSGELLSEGGEFLAGEGVAVVEWADRVAEWLPLPRVEVRLAHRGPEERELELVVLAAPPSAGPGALALESRLAEALARSRCTRGLEFLGGP